MKNVLSIILGVVIIAAVIFFVTTRLNNVSVPGGKEDKSAVEKNVQSNIPAPPQQDKKKPQYILESLRVSHIGDMSGATTIEAQLKAPDASSTAEDATAK